VPYLLLQILVEKALIETVGLEWAGAEGPAGSSPAPAAAANQVAVRNFALLTQRMESDLAASRSTYSFSSTLQTGAAMAEVYMNTKPLHCSLRCMWRHHTINATDHLPMAMLCTCMICGVFDASCITRHYSKRLAHDSLLQRNATVQHYSNNSNSNTRLCHASLPPLLKPSDADFIF